jgi:Cof subfamily protein (haloacid dehalogenase superfamily)
MNIEPVSVRPARKEEFQVKEKTPATDDPTFRMVALDLDGTLLQSNHKMADDQAEYIRSLQKRGLTVCIATGRAAPSVYEHIQKLNLPQPTPVVCSNGARGFYCNSQDCSQKEELFYNPVPKSVVERAIALTNERGFALHYYYEDAIYGNPTTDLHRQLMDTYTQLTGSTILPVQDNFQSLLEQDHLPSKILVLFDERQLSAAVEAYRSQFPPKDATIVLGAFDWFLEILNPNVNKGQGLANMCSILKIPLEDCIAMGDGANDVEFLQMAGLGIAMKNAKPLVQKAADLTMEWTNDQNGVMNTLQRLEKEGLLELEP